MSTTLLDLSLFKDEKAFERLKCPYCEQLLDNPVQPSCGHRLCQTCADKIVKDESPPRCPKDDCKEEFILEDGVPYFPDRFVRREIQELKIRCQFHNEGCKWEGKLADYGAHTANCDYSTTTKMRKCPLEPLGCSIKATMEDNELNEHLQESQYDHMAMLVNCMQLLTDKVNRMQSLTPMYSTERVDADRTDNGYETMSGYERIPITYPDFVEKDGSLTSLSKVRDPGQGLRSVPEKRLYTAAVEAHSSLQLRDLVTKEVDGLKDKMLSTVMDSLQSKEEEIASLRAQLTKVEKQIRSKSAELEDRDFRLSLIENSNHDGSMIWKIPQFSQRKADAENGKYTSIFSLPFYSGRYGYKMCLRLYIMGDGIGKGTHLSLFFVVMRGEFDNILQWPFTHKVTFKLINQAGGRDIVDTFQPDPMSSSFRKPKSDMNVASGCPRFVSHTELERGGFVIDDTIFIKCCIDTSTVRHP